MRQNSPKETLPRGEVSSLEKGVFQNTFNPTKGLDHVSSVVVQVPQFTVVALMRPPERVLFQHLVLFKLRPVAINVITKLQIKVK